MKIRVCASRAFIFGAVPLLLFVVPAFGGDGVALNISNEGIEDIFVTVYDTNTQPYSPVLQHERINGFTKVRIVATADEMGRANLSWSAASVDDRSRECGRGVGAGLENDALISVRVDAACSDGGEDH
jgi:hypothetical protein